MTFVLLGPWQLVSQLYMWQTTFGWEGMIQTNSTFFEEMTPINVENGQFTITVNPDEMYTITTLDYIYRATIPTPPVSLQFPGVYFDDFENYNVSSEARYFADQTGFTNHMFPLLAMTELSLQDRLKYTPRTLTTAM